MYALRKGWDLGKVTVDVDYDHRAKPRIAENDGKGKAWVRFDDGTDAILGGSHVER